MNYWSLSKVAQTTETDVKPPVLAPVQTPQPAVPQVPPTDTVVQEQPKPIAPQQQQKKPRAERMKTDLLELQHSIGPTISQIMKDFLPGGEHFRHSESFYDRNPKGYQSALSSFFMRPGIGNILPWQKWLKDKSGEAMRGMLGIDEQSINFSNTSSPTAIRYYLAKNPTMVGTALAAAVSARPQDFASAVNDEVGREANFQGQYQPSLQDETSTGGGVRGDLMGDKGFRDPNEYQSEDDVPTRDDAASAMSRKERSKIIAPEVRPGEKQFSKDILDMIAVKRGGLVSKIYDDLGQVEHKNKSFGDLRSKDSVRTNAIMWPMMGISTFPEKAGEADAPPVAISNWQEFLMKMGYPVEETSNSQFDFESMSEEFIYNFFDKDGHPGEELSAFFKEKATEYMTLAYEKQFAEELSQTPEEFKPKSHNFRAFDRMAKVSAACSHREWRAEKIKDQQMGRKDSARVGTAVRRYAFVSTKIPAILKKLNEVSKAKAGQYIPFGNEEKTGKKKFLHRYENPTDKNDPKNGSLLLREVQFHPEIPITNDSDLQSWIKENGKDTEITSFNWPSMARSIDRADYLPQMYDKIKKMDPSGLLRQKPIQSPLSEQLLQKMQGTNNSQPQNQIDSYRNARAEHLKRYIEQGGLDPKGLSQKIASRSPSVDRFDPNNPKKVRSRGPSSKNYGEHIGENPDLFISNILNGKPQKYNKSDFEALAWAMGELSNQQIKVEDIYAPHPTTYDIDNDDDWNDINATVNTSVAAFGRYIIHRSRIQQLRGFSDTAWSPKSIGLFLSLCQPHTNYSEFNKNEAGKFDSDVKSIGAPLQDVIAPGKTSLHPNLMDHEGLSGDGAERLDQFDNLMSPVTRTDIYNSRGNQLNPTNPGGLRVYHDVDENGKMIRDESGKPQNLREEITRANPEELWGHIQRSFQAAHPEMAVGQDKSNPKFDSVAVLKKMKEEKLQELSELSSRTAKNHNTYSSILNRTPEGAQAVADMLDKPMPQSGQEAQFIEQNFVHFVANEFADNDPKMNSQIDKGADYNKTFVNRWKEVISKSGLSEEEYCLEYVSSRASKAKAATEALASRAKAIDGFIPQAGKLPSGEIQKIISTLVPMKYLRRKYDGPSYTDEQGRVRWTTPFDYVQQWDKQDNPTHVSPGKRHPSVPANGGMRQPVASIVELTVKTATSMDRLAAIRHKLERLAMPTEFIESMLDKLENDYVTNLTVLSRNEHDGRYAKNSDTDQVRRRVWSLL